MMRFVVHYWVTANDGFWLWYLEDPSGREIAKCSRRFSSAEEAATACTQIRDLIKTAPVVVQQERG
jgi:hypothetical protein